MSELPTYTTFDHPTQTNGATFKGKVHYWEGSLDEYVAGVKVQEERRDYYQSPDRDFTKVSSYKEAYGLAAMGWEEGLTQSMPIAERAVELIDREHPFTTFNGYNAVTGATVDVARYLSGEPECMVEFTPTEISRVGRVISLVAGISVSAAISPDSMIQRGTSFVALALALEKAQHACELWVDMTSASNSTLDNKNIELGDVVVDRILVKGARDVVDPARIAYAFAHPSMLRALGFSHWHGIPSATAKRGLGVPGHYGYPVKEGMYRNFGEGTIYLPGLISNHDIPDAYQFVEDQLQAIGLLEGNEQ